MDFRIVVPTALTTACLVVILVSPLLDIVPTAAPDPEPATTQAPDVSAAAPPTTPVVAEAPPAAPNDGDESWRRGETSPGSGKSDITAAAVRAKTANLNEARLNLIDQEPGNWLVHAGDYYESRWSPLNQINLDTIGQLNLAWSFDTGTDKGLEASPIVVDGVMFSTGSWSSVYANDAKTGELLWEYDPQAPKEWLRRMCCDAVNRGVAVWEGKVFVATVDGRLIALDAGDGQEIWQVNTIDRTKAYSITGAPRVVKGKVIIGNGGGEMGVRGYFSAYDANTGELVWRFYTVPGDPSQPYEHPELEMAAKTWSGDVYWKYGGGGTVWDSMAYDPSLDMLYVGVGNGAPWNREVRSPGGGDNLFLSSILAIRPDNGELVWHYQTTPGDTWDYTATQTIILADFVIQGRLRKTLMQAPKNGFFYVIDRETGELISADPYVKQTWTKGIDMATGRPIEDPEQHYWEEPKEIWPGPRGGHNWQPMAYNQKDRLVFIPTLEESGIYLHTNDYKQDPLAWNRGFDMDLFADIIESLPEMPASHGSLKAWDPLTRKVVWEVPSPYYAYNGGILTTAGDLVFQGTADGRFVAYHSATGEVVWDVYIQTGIMAPPVTYEVDGEQYLAVMAGYGGSMLAGVAIDAYPRASEKYGNAGRLLVFKLGGTQSLPVLAELDRSIPEQPAIDVSDEVIADGARLYAARCMFCHGVQAASMGTVPDLRRMSLGVHEQFDGIVREGTRAEQGMPGFGDLLDADQVEAIRAYIIHRANISRQKENPAISN